MATHGYHLGPFYDGSIWLGCRGYGVGVSMVHTCCSRESVNLVLYRYIYGCSQWRSYIRDDITMQLNEKNGFECSFY